MRVLGKACGVQLETCIQGSGKSWERETLPRFPTHHAEKVQTRFVRSTVSGSAKVYRQQDIVDRSSVGGVCLRISYTDTSQTNEHDRLAWSILCFDKDNTQTDGCPCSPII